MGGGLFLWGQLMMGSSKSIRTRGSTNFHWSGMYRKGKTGEQKLAQVVAARKMTEAGDCYFVEQRAMMASFSGGNSCVVI
jgi:hypothetical protein